VPFRNSKLTQLLQDSLCGQAKVMMLMQVAPEASSYGETVSTLAFAKRVSEVTLGQVAGGSGPTRRRAAPRGAIEPPGGRRPAALHPRHCTLRPLSSVPASPLQAPSRLPTPLQSIYP
jgi:hypothetical protein